MNKRKPKALYHYCSLQTFRNILESKSVWLSDIRKSNDSQELRWMLGQCRYYLFEHWTNYLDIQKEKDGFQKVQSKDFDAFNELINKVDYFKKEHSKNWVFCLSEKRDDIGQWRGYADDGKGISLGFKRNYLDYVLQIFCSLPDADFNFFFDKVKYSKTEVRDFFENTAELSKITDDMFGDQVMEVFENCFAASLWHAPFFKNETFKVEKEWRIVFSMYLSDIIEGQKPEIPNNINRYSDKLTVGNLGFSQRGAALVSHLELGISNIKQAIHSITIGPKCNVEPLDLRMYLVSLGILDSLTDKSIEIHKSMVPYK